MVSGTRGRRQTPVADTDRDGIVDGSERDVCPSLGVIVLY